MIVFGILTPLENLMRSVLDWLHSAIGLPWAWSIVALTIIVRMLLVPLTVRQIHSMQNLQRHAPEMKAIQQRWKHDKERQREELMSFYRENNINPAASCLPMVAQIPVFFSLYFVLRNFARHPPGGDLSWLHILPSIADPANSHWSGYLLLAIYATSQTASTLLMSTTMDRMQRTLLLILPIAFLFVVLHFPAGLVLYWVTTNLWTVGQGLITRKLAPKPQPVPKRSSRTAPKEAEPAGDGSAPQQEASKPQPAGGGAPRKVKRKKKKARR
jgi:YidC/Oxa1 family membrane protein insertase